jgi:hypothetical protein
LGGAAALGVLLTYVVLRPLWLCGGAGERDEGEEGEEGLLHVEGGGHGQPVGVLARARVERCLVRQVVEYLVRGQSVSSC